MFAGTPKEGVKLFSDLGFFFGVGKIVSQDLIGELFRTTSSVLLLFAEWVEKS